MRLRAPQSNQRGIETPRRRIGFEWPRGGLNRTSVGLKPEAEDCLSLEFIAPQSNQRGIETPFPPPMRSGAFMPQSNQRGIETWDTSGLPDKLVFASIEPAWD